jgi:serine/threonine-protein kinase
MKRDGSDDDGDDSKGGSRDARTARMPALSPERTESSSEVRRVRARPPPPLKEEEAPFGLEPTSISKSGPAPREPREEPFGFEPTSISKSGPSPREAPGLERTSVRSVTSDQDPLVGAMLGEYRVLAPLGSGGMGVVYRGEHPVIGRPVAIKILRREYASDPAHVRRFLDEARLVNAARHPGIVDVFSIGDTPSGEPYLVMELLEGEPLDALISRRGALPPKEVVPLLVQILGALGAAHAAGVIHRDLKPANIFIVQLADGTTYPKLLDFGLAKRGEVGARLRQTSVGGTPLYIAPEQARGEDIGPQTDLYSLGCIAYELLTGAPPFTAGHLHELLDAHATLAPRPLRPQVRALPPEFERLVMRLLAKDPRQRPSSAREVREALEGLQGRLASGASPTRVSRPAATSVSAAPVPTSTSVSTPALSRPVWPFVLGGVLLLALGAGGAALVIQRPPPPVVETPRVAPPPPVKPVEPVEPEPTPPPEPVVAEPPPEPVPEEPKPKVTPRPTTHTKAQVRRRWGELVQRAEQLPDNLKRSALTELEALETCTSSADQCWNDLSDFEAVFFRKR